MTVASRDPRQALERSRRWPFLAPVLVAIAAVSGLSTVAVVAIWQNARTVQAQAAVRVRSNADAAARAVTRQGDDFRRTVEAGANNQDLAAVLARRAPTTEARAVDVLATLARGKDAPVALLTDRGGHIVAAYPQQQQMQGLSFSYRDWFKGASRSREPYVSSAFRSAAVGQPLVVGIASAVVVDGGRVGCLALLWQLESVRAVAEGSRRDDGVAVVVTDQRGQPLVGTLASDDRGQPRRTLVSDMTNEALAGRRVSRVRGGQVLASVPVPGLGWTATAALPSRIAMAPAAAFRRYLLWVVGMAVVVVLGSLLLNLRSVSRRINAQRLSSDHQQRLHSARAALRVSEQRFRRVFDEGLTGKALADQSGRILSANVALADMVGVGPGWFVDRALSSCFEDSIDKERVDAVVVERRQELRGEMALHTNGPQARWGRVVISRITQDDGSELLLAQVQDVTGRRTAEQLLTRLALHDELTGLPNRRLLMERCEQTFAMALSGRAGTSVTAFFLDLDGFKTVNDRGGHAAGDLLLVAIAADLGRGLRPCDTLARVGGDEFVVLLGQDDGLAFVRSVAERVCTTVRRQLTVNGTSVPVSASLGIARVDLARDPDVQPEQLLRRADAAMYSAKERGGDRQEIYDSELHARTQGRRALEQAVRDGLEHDRLGLAFQPVVDIDSGEVVGAEALMRLTASDGALVPTLPAILAAEQAGLAELVGDRVQDLALRALKGWPDALTVAVNVSARELTGNDFHRRVETCLGRHDVDPRRLILEITESSMLHSGPAALQSLSRLRDLGVRVAIDDFGMAYATLQNLLVLPVDVLKVDTTFTAGLTRSKAAAAVVHGIASMAFEMDIPCIVEGIETEEQLDALRGMSVLGQGWLWGRPRTDDAAPPRISAPRARAAAD